MLRLHNFQIFLQVGNLEVQVSEQINKFDLKI